MPEITVSGHADTAVAADEAVLTIRISARNSDRAQAIAECTSDHERVTSLAASLVETKRARLYLADAISTSSHSWRDDEGAQRAEHEAVAVVRLWLVQLETVNELAYQLTVDGADVDVSWELSQERRSGLHSELRAQALADAKAAADDFVAAIGSPGAELITLREVGSSYLFAGGNARLASAAIPGVSQRDVDVSIEIEAVYRTTPAWQVPVVEKI